MVVHMRDEGVPVASDPRLDFLRDFILKALRLKPDKWDRMFISDEQRSFAKIGSGQTHGTPNESSALRRRKGRRSHRRLGGPAAVRCAA